MASPFPDFCECNHEFVELLKQLEKKDTPIDNVGLVNPEEERLSSILQARLISLTTKTACAIVESTQGNGCEA